MSQLRLTEDFPARERDAWVALAEKGLRGASFDSLRSRTEGGLTRGPLFDAGDRPDTHGALAKTDEPLLDGRPWHICAPVEDDDLAYANGQLLADLAGGASAVRIGHAGITRRADLKRLFEGVHLDLVPLVFAPGSGAAQYAPGTEELYGTPVTLGLDPLSDLPSCPESWRAFTLDASAVHEAGGHDVLELAAFTAIAAESFRRHGANVAGAMSAQFACGTDAHLNIVKLRAARRLWQGVSQAFGRDEPIPFHAVSSLRMMQAVDAWTNLLRTMSAGMGAVAGGAEYITLRPFTDTPEDRRLGDPTPFASRVARNQQILLMEESHLGLVHDPAHGSYFHERLTEDLAQSAWALFQTIEGAGGWEAYVGSGGLDQALDRAREAREETDAPILGVTLHPGDDVRAPEVR